MAGLFGAIAGGLQVKGDYGDGVTYGTIDDLWLKLLGGHPAKSGAVVNWQTALQVTTVLGCARRICEAQTIPCKVYKREASGDRIEARDHPLSRILAIKPNDWQTEIEYRETISLYVALTGNAVSYVGRVNGKIAELIPFEPGRVTVKRNVDYSLTYRVMLLDGSYSDFSQDEVWHVRGMSWDSAIGLNATHLTREAIGLALATEETEARLHSNGAQPGGILSTDKELGKDARERLKAQWGAQQVGLANKFRTAVLDNGLKWQSLSMSGVDMQHVELRNQQVEQICTAFGVLPIMIGHSDKSATYASAEQMFLAHLVHTVRPWNDRFASSMDRWLLTPEEWDAGYYVGFVDAVFLRPAMKDKAEYYKIALGGAGNPGWLRPNDVRGFDDQPRVEGGDYLYAPVNAGPIGPDGVPIVAKPAAAPAAGG